MVLYLIGVIIVLSAVISDIVINLIDMHARKKKAKIGNLQAGKLIIGFDDDEADPYAFLELHTGMDVIMEQESVELCVKVIDTRK